MKFTKEYLVQVNYKSGIMMTFWVEKFTISNKEVSWTTVEKPKQYPLMFNLDDVESTWVIDTRTRFRLKSGD